MRTLLRIIIFLLVIFLIAVIYLAFLPAKFSVERSIKIQAPQDVIYNDLSDFKNWPAWYPSGQGKNKIEFEMTENTQAPNGKYLWSQAGKEDQGHEVFTESAEPEMLRSTRISENSPKLEHQWTLKPSDNEHTITSWMYSGNLSFFNRWRASQYEKKYGLFIENGLAKFKTKIESEVEKKQNIEVQRGLIDEQPYFGITVSASIEEMGAGFYAEQFENIATYLGLSPTAIQEGPFVIYHKWDEEEGTATVECGLLSTSDLVGNDKIIKAMRYGGPVAFVDQYGKYEESGKAHLLLENYLQERNLELSSPPIEIFIKGPADSDNSQNWLTRVLYPIDEE